MHFCPGFFSQTNLTISQGRQATFQQLRQRQEQARHKIKMRRTTQTAWTRPREEEVFRRQLCEFFPKKRPLWGKHSSRADQEVCQLLQMGISRSDAPWPCGNLPSPPLNGYLWVLEKYDARGTHVLGSTKSWLEPKVSTATFFSLAGKPRTTKERERLRAFPTPWLLLLRLHICGRRRDHLQEHGMD